MKTMDKMTKEKMMPLVNSSNTGKKSMKKKKEKRKKTHQPAQYKVEYTNMTMESRLAIMNPRTKLLTMPAQLMKTRS